MTKPSGKGESHQARRAQDNGGQRVLGSVPSLVLCLARRVYLMVLNNKEKLGLAKTVFDTIQEKLRQTIEPVPVQQLMLGLESPHVIKAIDEFTTKAADRFHQCCMSQESDLASA